MRNLLDFFDAENRKDWKAYERFLAPDVEWPSSARRSVRARWREREYYDDKVWAAEMVNSAKNCTLMIEARN